MAGFPAATGRPENAPPDAGYSVTPAAPEVAEDAAQGVHVAELVPSDGDETRWRFSIDNSKFQLALASGTSAVIQRSGTGTMDAGQSPTEPVNLTVTDKWGQSRVYLLSIAVLDVGGGNVGPTYTADATISTNDAALDGAVINTVVPTNTPVPNALIGVSIFGGSSLFEVEAANASIRIKRKVGANWTAQIGVPQDITINWEHATGAGSFDRTIEIADSSAAQFLTSLTWTNTSGSVMAAGTPSFPFMIVVKDGEIAAGGYPQIKTQAGVVLDIMLGPKTFYASGFVREMPCIVAFPEVAGSASLTLEVWSGGSAPSASGLTLGTIDPGDYNVRAIGETSGNLDGTWDAGCDDFRANAIRSYAWMDGPFGKWFTGDHHFKSGGTPHGQAEARTRIQAFDGLGYRIRTIYKQWHADVSSPTATSRRFTFAVYKEGATNKIRDSFGYSTSTAVASRSAIIQVPHYAGIACCGTDGGWDWVQGDGSLATEPCTMTRLPVRDYEHFRAAKTLPPFVLDVVPTGGTDVWLYHPMGKGQTLAGTGGTPHTNTSNSWGYTSEEVGLIEQFHINALLRQLPNDFNNLLVGGLVPLHHRMHAHRSTTGVPVAVDHGPDDDGVAQWTGMGASQRSWRMSDTGFVSPTANSSVWFSEFGGPHYPNLAEPAYALSGDDTYLDIIANIACTYLAQYSQGGIASFRTDPVSNGIYTPSANRHISLGGSTYYNCYIQKGSLGREAACQVRSVWAGEAHYPPSHPNGANVKGYLARCRVRAGEFVAAWVPSRSQEWRDMALVEWNGSPGDQYHYIAFAASALAHVAASSEDENWLDFCEFESGHWDVVHAAGDISLVSGGNATLFDENNNWIYDPDQTVVLVGPTRGIASNAGTNRFTATGFTPANGMLIGWENNTGVRPFAAAVARKQFIMLNVAGQEFDLAPYSNPTVPETITTTGVWGSVLGGGSWWANLRGAVTNGTYQGASAPGINDQFDRVYAAVKLQKAALGARFGSPNALAAMDAYTSAQAPRADFRAFAREYEAS